MLKKPMITEELFDKIKGILQEKGKLPDILDYGLGAYRPVPIKTYEFDLKSNLAYGGSEGIYLDLWIEYFEDDKKRTSSIGTFKTLHENEEAMHIMAALLADFILEERAYVNANLDDFTWEGADVYPLDESGNRLKWGYSCSNMEVALKRKDELLGKGVRYETAGSLQEGKKVWLFARLPREYIIAGERISPYLVFSNTHDGSGSVKVAITPVRVVCNNTLNLALNTAKRSFSMIHTGNIQDKIQEAKDTLFMAEEYMDCLDIEFEQLRRQKMTDEQVKEYIELLLPMEKEPTPIQQKNIIRLRKDMEKRYYDAPDLQKVGNNAYRFINAVSDFATHSNPLRRTANYNENLFARTVDGNPLIDKAYQLVKAA